MPQLLFRKLCLLFLHDKNITSSFYHSWHSPIKATFYLLHNVVSNSYWQYTLFIKKMFTYCRLSNHLIVKCNPTFLSWAWRIFSRTFYLCLLLTVERSWAPGSEAWVYDDFEFPSRHKILHDLDWGHIIIWGSSRWQ